MNKRHYEHTLPNIRGSLSNTYHIKASYKKYDNITRERSGNGCNNFPGLLSLFKQRLFGLSVLWVITGIH